MPRVSKVFFPFLSLPSPLHSPSFFLSPCPLPHSPFCWEVRIRGGGGSLPGAAATAAVEPQLLRPSKWSWWVKKSRQNGGFCSPSSPQDQRQRQPSLLTRTQHLPIAAKHPAGCTPVPGSLEGLHCPPLTSVARAPASPFTPLSTVTGGLCPHCQRRLFLTGQGLMLLHTTVYIQIHPHAHRASYIKWNRDKSRCPLPLPPTIPLFFQFPIFILHLGESAKNLLQHKKWVVLVLSLAEWEHANGRKRWGSKRKE